ncbi:flavodoxin family protein [Streptomyces sp. NPDC087908]|uniref:flavodoxin family protein n=1 Tax=unclassified Streptomyces TaxID=2593676 RepID=UPI0011CE342F|nr:flavodoxin domain-containing protein [Streptomyces sp. adm13(2018)]TXS15341.1 flavodoxin [Streptomyces sp. adm13(2018)]
MRAVIVYESLFGNTRDVADAIGEGVKAAHPEAEVECLPVVDAVPERIGPTDLLVVGGPTHMRGMTTGMSRRMGLKAEAKEAENDERPFAPEVGAEGPGVRDWFHDTLPKAGTGTHAAAAFDTRADMRLAGAAAGGIARRLRGHGYELVAEPEGFVIEDAEGPLRAGERDRARAWGASLHVA